MLLPEKGFLWLLKSLPPTSGPQPCSLMPPQASLNRASQSCWAEGNFSSPKLFQARGEQGAGHQGWPSLALAAFSQPLAPA